MVLEGDWTSVQSFGASEILRGFEFSPSPPQRVGEQQLVKRLEEGVWWVQVRRIADGWMGGSQRQERPPANCCPESFSSLYALSALPPSGRWRFFWLFSEAYSTRQGPSGSPTIDWFSPAETAFNRAVCHAQVRTVGGKINNRTMIRFRRPAPPDPCIPWATCQHSRDFINYQKCWKLVGFKVFEDFQQKILHGVRIVETAVGFSYSCRIKVCWWLSIFYIDDINESPLFWFW